MKNNAGVSVIIGGALVKKGGRWHNAGFEDAGIDLELAAAGWRIDNCF